MRALLDVNVLIAVLDPDHAFHRTASGWLAEHAEHGWASCPLTQNGCIRIMAQPGYSSPVGMGLVMAHLQAMCESPAHRFMADDVSLLSPTVFNHAHIHGHRQITDVYLLALAVKKAARMVTFEGRIRLSCVLGAQGWHLVVL